MIKNGTPIRTVAIIGAGPVGIAAAAHLIERGLRPTVLEKGASAGHALQQWGHVRLFTPWQYVIDKAVLRLLEKSGWQAPKDTHLPTGQELVDEYLAPAAATAELKGCLIYQANVLGVSKKGLSKSSSLKRADAPFTVHYETADGTHHIMEADAVIDASGTWDLPNPMGADGLKVPGESAHQDLISYGIPDILGKDKPIYEGKTSLVLGGGHSAINAVLDLLSLRAVSPATKLIWGIRGDSLERLLGGGLNDELPARGALGIAAKRALNEGSLKMLASLRIRQINRWDNALRLEITTEGTDKILDVDRVIAATGFRPQLELLSELRLDMDDTVQAPSQLAPMIDPNLHFCGSVKPHGVAELSHPDANFYIVGMKSYGRAPTFLMLTRYEQVRSIADELSGDTVAARKIELILPETGVCISDPLTDTASGGACCAPSAKAQRAASIPSLTSTSTSTSASASTSALQKEKSVMSDPIQKTEQDTSACCGGAAPAGVDACCVKDATAKANGEAGCGCNSSPTEPLIEQPKTASGCC